MSRTAASTDVPRRRFTVDEVHRMVDDGILHEDEAVELLDGELVVVSPQGPAHAARLAELQQLLADAYRGVAHVRTQLPVDARPFNLPEPDLAVVQGNPRDFADHHPTGRDMVLVIEIARTSQGLDRQKAAIYAAAGVPTYWLIDLSLRQVEVYSRADPTMAMYAPAVITGPAGEVELPTIGVRWTVSTLIG